MPVARKKQPKYLTAGFWVAINMTRPTILH
jgi:hypothetical protein